MHSSSFVENACMIERERREIACLNAEHEELFKELDKVTNKKKDEGDPMSWTRPTPKTTSRPLQCPAKGERV